MNTHTSKRETSVTLLITEAIKTMHLPSIKKHLIALDLEHRDDIKELLNDLKPIFKAWQKEDQNSQLVGEVLTRESRCIACIFGKQIIRFDFSYKHKSAPAPENQIVYTQSFGIRIEEKNDHLQHIQVCNAFLNITEMESFKD
ncbi:hypothetical protein RBU60_11410 [Mesonia sp. MT50]|uniref:Uncharacterized protein n=1 Tax=Mesonia profundi TaxID=3070998 RepID=A0ABU1A4H9_9FLAO|nr:hypothetical protein [Mesonia profundi]MDQ7918186.1 hypothetical protein [Mesonia profundi]